MTDFCMCALQAKIVGTSCKRCGKSISPDRLTKLGIDPGTTLLDSKTEKISNQVLEVTNTDAGAIAALKVNNFGLLFDKIGAVANIVNNVFPGIALLILMATQAEGEMYIVAVFVLPIFWGLGYLQIAAIRGLASYFQMRSIDFLERRGKP